MKKIINQLSLCALLALPLTLPAFAAEPKPLSDQFVGNQYITVSNQGIFLLKDNGRLLVKFSPNTLEEVETITLTKKGKRIFSNDTRVIVLSQNGSNAQFHLYNGTDLSLLGLASFDRDD